MTCFLNVGSTGDKVRQVQDALRRLGLYSRTVDGSYGPYTKEAVIAFQKRKGLVVDGCVGDQTWSALGLGGGSVMPEGCFLAIGSTGDRVKKVQEALRALGFYTAMVDGEFGPYTKTAVTNFQKSRNLYADGCVGTQTWDALGLSSGATPIPIPTPTSIVYVESSWLDEDQDTNYTCGPTSVAMAMTALGIDPGVTGKYDNEAHMASEMGTTTRGTGHPQIIAGVMKEAAQQGLAVKVTEMTFAQIGGWEGLGKTIVNPKMAVVAHGNTAGWRRYYIGTYGHYVFVVKVDMTKKLIYIADPARQATLVYPFAEFKVGLDLVSQPSFIVIEKA